MTTLASRLQAVRNRIDTAAAAAGRLSGDIRLIAVSKTFAPAAIAEAYAAGQVAFGENYLQEALGKIQALSAWPLEWHVASPDREIGPVGDVRPSAGVASPEGPLLRPCRVARRIIEWRRFGTWKRRAPLDWGRIPQGAPAPPCRVALHRPDPEQQDAADRGAI